MPFNTAVKPVKCLMNRVVSVMGTFFPDGTSNPDATKNVGRYFSVAYSATGIFTLTLTAVGKKILSKSVSLQQPQGALADLQVQFSDISLANKTVIIQTVKTSDGTAVAPAAYNANQSISFSIDFLESDVEY